MSRLLVIFALILSTAGLASSQVATSLRVVRNSPMGELSRVIVTVNGQERTVATEAWNAWLIDHGRAVVYSGTDGAGGYENEGQSLWRYDVSTGMRIKLVSEVYAIKKVAETRTRSGRAALLVSMVDGGLGAPHVAIVDPMRGEVWRHRVARFIGLRNGRVAVGLYTPERFEGKWVGHPARVIYVDLDSVLKRPASRYKPVK